VTDRQSVENAGIEIDDAIMAQGNLTNVDYWAGLQAEKINLPDGGVRPLWLRHIDKYLPTSSDTTCLEVGVVPGGMMLFFASEYKYKCTGIDFSPKIDMVAQEFARKGIEATFARMDFFEWEPDEKFDFVYSVGFIEHFEDYQSVAQRHWGMVKPGGLMLLSVPTPTPIQWFLRLLIYEKNKMRQVMESHNLAAMSKRSLLKAAKSCAGAQVMFASYTAEMTITPRVGDPGVRPGAGPILKPFIFGSKVARRLGISSSIFSPEATVLARKPKDAC
jgi:2-polyprenyl-3-methyl-5-hydroxy-6-metoxy-1,4-benzoquinol methylase